MNDTPATKRRVQRGAKLLDKLCPGWFKGIKMTKLEMKFGSPDTAPKGCGCILAQTYGSYSTGLNLLDVWEKEYEFGFNASSYEDDEFKALERDWKDEIRKRRAAA